MKSASISAISLVIGIAISWFVKSYSYKQQSAFHETNNQDYHELRAASLFDSMRVGSVMSSNMKTMDRSKVVSRTEVRNGAEGKVEKQGQSEVVQRLIGIQRKKFEARLEKLKDKLHLTPEQRQAAKDKMEAQFALYGDLLDADGTSAGTAKMHQAMAELKIDPLEGIFSSAFQREQLSKYQEFRAEELRNKTDAKALKDLSAFSASVDGLSREQRDIMYQFFSDHAAAGLGGERIAGIYDSIGVQVDDELGLEQLIADNADQFDKSNPSAAREKYRELVEEKVEDRIAAVKPFLSDSQLQQYRLHLEEKLYGALGDPAKAQTNAKSVYKGEQ